MRADETVEALADALADLLGIYSQGLRFEGMTVAESRALRGSGYESGSEGHADDCACRQCWCGAMARRIRGAVAHEEHCLRCQTGVKEKTEVE
jgi:hypothetical protein